MQMNSNAAILVTGASGHMGSRIVELLLDEGSVNIIAGTRAPERMAGLRERGAELRRVDFDDPGSCEAAFAGVDRVVMVSTDAVAEPDRRVRQHRAAIEAAAKAHVKHLVYTSFARSDAGSPVPLCADHHATEQALRASGLPFTALRNSLYAEAILRRLPAMLSATDVPGLTGGGGIAYIARDDCARAAAAVAASDEPPLGAIELTGSEVINDEHLTALVSRITGRPLRFVPMDADALIRHLAATGVPMPRAAAKVALDIALATGHLEFTSGSFAALTGRPPTRLHDFLLSAGIASVPA